MGSDKMQEKILAALQHGNRMSRQQLMEYLKIPGGKVTTDYRDALQTLANGGKITLRRGRSGGIFLTPISQGEARGELRSDADTQAKSLDREAPPKQAGFIKFYGLYWRKSAVAWDERRLLGQPQGWMGKGKTAKDFDPATVQMNFWEQKGVYILYDTSLYPVYAGQAGLSKKGSLGIGDRLLNHRRGVYRNGWSLFSWFGFLETGKIELKDAGEYRRMKPKWEFNPQSESELNQLLASFEAILIEGFSPRFNSRGGNLGNAVLVDQFDPSY